MTMEQINDFDERGIRIIPLEDKDEFAEIDFCPECDSESVLLGVTEFDGRVVPVYHCTSCNVGTWVRV